MQGKSVENILSGITRPDLHAAASTAALVMCFSSGAPSRSAKVTFASLYRFSREHADLQDLSTIAEVNPFDDNPVSKSLSSLVYESGTYYFGPMFDCRSDLSIDRDTIMANLAEKGFLVEAVSRLEDTTLDMFYTRVLELGL